MDYKAGQGFKYLMFLFLNLHWHVHVHCTMYIPGGYLLFKSNFNIVVHCYTFGLLKPLRRLVKKSIGKLGVL